jgi:hypothetical protein
MFPESLFDFVLEQFADELSGLTRPMPAPLQTDSFLARSVMQKATRRGMTDLALRAAATLVTTDRRVLWRRLLVTALEDLGVGEIDLLARITSAYRDREWRAQMGGDWPIVSALIVQACTGTRDQSSNDLWNIAKNAPDLDCFKASLCEAEMGDLIAVMTDEAAPIEQRGVAVLMALGEDAGAAAPVHIRPDPSGIFGGFAGAGRYSHVSAIYEEAYRQSRLALAPLALCLWSESRLQVLATHDDDLPPVTWIGEVPSFSLDQYTRPGLAAIRRYAFSSPAWREFAERWSIPRREWIKAAGELLFRAEGAVVTNRRTWTTGQSLYETSGVLGCFLPVEAVREGRALIRRELPAIDQQRRLSTTTTRPVQSRP